MEALLAPPPHEEHPYSKNPKLSVNVEGWKEQPIVMRIFWLGMFQLACLAGWVTLFFYFLQSFVGTPGTVALVIVGIPTLKKPIGALVVKLVVHQLDTLWAWLMHKFFILDDSAIVHDGLLCRQNISLLRAKYNQKNHCLFIVYPCREEDSWLYAHRYQRMEYTWSSWNLRPATEETIEKTLQDKALDGGGKSGHAVVYIHGGGFVAANASVLLQEAVTMAREGVTVYALDYPLAPTDPFPSAIYSILDSLKWLRKYRHVDQVTLVGDSAGGSLAAYAACIATSPDLLQNFLKETSKYSNSPLSQDDIVSFNSSSELPKVVGMVSVYGVLDGETFRKRLEKLSWLEWTIAVNGLNFCLDCYKNPDLDYPPHFCDLLTHPKTRALFDVKAFPPTLLVCGNKDPLINSTYKAMEILNDLGVSTTVKIFSGRHGFVGFPRAWIGPELRSQAAQADAAIRAFVRERSPKKETKRCGLEKAQ